MENDKLKDDNLLELLHKALIQWKAAEVRAEKVGEVYVLKNRNQLRAAALQKIYVELHKEARKRALSLSTEQLLARIIYTGEENAGYKDFIG